MATVVQIREVLANRLRGIGGVQVADGGYMLSDQTPPFAHLIPEEFTYDQAMNRGLDFWDWRIVVAVGINTDIGAQKKLDGFLNPTSDPVKDAIEEERPSPVTLGGLIQDLHVVSCSGYQQASRPDGTVLLHADWTVRLYL